MSGLPTPFNDHFGAVAAAYADCRPGYPPELFSWLVGQVQTHGQAWDCGTGSGQAAVGLADYFVSVFATDASTAQIAHAVPHARVRYAVAPAEASGLPAGSVDLLTVAQALHWFDLPAFFAEARRVLKPGGLIAAWTYGVLHVEGEAVDARVQRFYAAEVGPYWPPERRHVESGYRDLPFPFDPVQAPTLALRADWSLPQLLGYFRSWSATARYQEATGQDPVATLAETLMPLWGDPDTPRTIRWPLALRAGRV